MFTSPPTAPPDRSTPSAEPRGTAPTPHHSLWQTLDVAIIVATWGVVLWLVADHLSNEPSGQAWALFRATMFLLAVFIPPWLLVRVLIPTTPLLDSGWRAQLAVTPLDPAWYLWRRLRAPFLWTILALPLAQLTLLAALEARTFWRMLSNFPPQMLYRSSIVSVVLLQLLALLSAFVLVYCIAAAGVFDQLRRQCDRGGAYSVLGTVVWILLSFGVPLGTFQGFVLLPRFLPVPATSSFLLMTGTQTALCIAALVYARRCWKRTCRTYFVFEPNTTPPVPERRVGGWE